MDGCGIYSSFYWYLNLYEATRSGWVMAIFLKGTQMAYFGQNAKGEPFAQITKLAIFLAQL